MGECERKSSRECGAMATHGRWEESKHPAGEWSHFLHQSRFSGFLQAPRHELLHRLCSDWVSRLSGGFQSEDIFFAEEGKLRVPGAVTQGSGALALIMGLFFFFFWKINILVLPQVLAHTCGKQTGKCTGRKGDRSVCHHRCLWQSETLHFPPQRWFRLFPPQTPLWTLLHVRIVPILEPLLKSAGKKTFPRTKSSHFILQGYLWEPGDCASSTLENLNAFWWLKGGHKGVTLNCPENYIPKNPDIRKRC